MEKLERQELSTGTVAMDITYCYMDETLAASNTTIHVNEMFRCFLRFTESMQLVVEMEKDRFFPILDIYICRTRKPID